MPKMLTRASHFKIVLLTFLAIPSANAEENTPRKNLRDSEYVIESMFLTKTEEGWQEGREQCQEAGGKLACEALDDKRFFEEILPLIIPISSQDGSASFWYTGRNCTDQNELPGAFMTVYDINGQPYKQTFTDLHSLHFAMCRKLLLSSSSETPPTSVTTMWSSTTHSDTTTVSSSSAKTTQSAGSQVTLNFTTSSSTLKFTPSSSTMQSTVTYTNEFSSISSITDSTSSPTTEHTTTPVPEPKCCPTVSARGILWEKHCGKSEYVSKPCPEGSVGKAEWFCDTTRGEWSQSTPTLQDCKSKFITDLYSKINESDVVEALDLLKRETPRYGGDILEMCSILSKVVMNVETFIDLVDNSTDKKELALSIMDNVVTLGDSMLSDKEIWKDLTKEGRVETATKLLQDEERTAFQCAHNIGHEAMIYLEKNTLTMQLIKREKGAFQGNLALPRLPENVPNEDIKFILPYDFEEAISDEPANHTVVVFFKYKDLGDILITKQDHSLQNVSSSSTVNSPVLSVSLNDPTLKVKLDTQALFVVPHTNANANSSVCVFWNTTSLNWEDEGCDLVKTNATHTECACDHLTSFAVLMDIHNVLDTLTKDDLDRLETITLVGSIISIIFLSAAIVVTTVYRALWGLSNSVHRNLCVTLLVAEVLFVVGSGRTEIQVLCSVIAGLLHYFFTAAFCWTFLEAVVIYLFLYKVFSSKISYTKTFYAFGYGIPLLIVAISATARPSGYGSETSCWLNTENGFRWSFVGPVAFILVVNIIALVYALVVVMKLNERVNSKWSPSVTRSWILGALTLAPLLGLTWIMGFVMVRNDPVSVYAFTVLNSLQGVAIFVVLCLLHQNSRKCLVKSFGKYTHLITMSSLVSSSTRSNAYTETRSQSTSNHRLSRQGLAPYPLRCDKGTTQNQNTTILQCGSLRSDSFAQPSGGENGNIQNYYSTNFRKGVIVVSKHGKTEVGRS